MIPIGKLLRHKSGKSDTGNKVSLSSLDEQIAQLESQISSDSDSDDSDSNQETERVKEFDPNSSLIFEKDSNGNVVRLVSALQEEERIAPLPLSLLPSSQCKFVDKNNNNKDDRKRKISFFDDPDVKRNSRTRTSSGLMKTVHEMISQYEPASHEKRPNYCRVCKFQGSSIAELEEHRLTQSHKDMVEMEKRLCFCKLCRKQFTSPEQLKEHLKGKAHIERLEKIRSSQSDRKKYC
jgi:hypothetical protein